MVLRIRCEVCGSRKWHRLDGNQVCEDGHILAGTMEESSQLAPGESSAFMFATRRLHQTNTTKKVRGITHDHFHGQRERFLLFQCLQWIMREQLNVMIEELGYPKELEGCVKELWSMLVVSSDLSNAPRKFSENDEAVGSFSGMKEPNIGKNGRAKLKRKRDQSRERAKSKSRDGRGRGRGHASDFKESADERSDKEEEEDDEDSEGGDENDERGDRIRSHNPRHSPRLDYTLSVIYLACLTLRIPVMFHDIVK
jgi:hypothetical protein